MSKTRLFIENFIIYGLGGIVCKSIPFIMTPVITRLMPNSDYYGISDMSNTIMNFCSAFAVLGMHDAMYRMFFEKDEQKYRESVCSTAFMFTIITSLVVFIIMLFLRHWIASLFFGTMSYTYISYITASTTLVGSTNAILAAPTRMQNKRKIYLAANIIIPVISYSISIPLLLNGYYVIALPLAALISSFIMEIIFGIMNRKWFHISAFDTVLLKQLLKLGIPLVPNFLIYWLFNSADRLMITHILGVGESGIYAVGAKLGMASQLIYMAFSGGWQFFAFSTMKEEDQVKTNSKVFECLGIFSYAATLFVCAWAKPIYEILFTVEYHRAFIVSPYLFLSPLLQMLFQVEANQFLVIRKTWPNMFILSIGAISNVVINLFLIPHIGIEGAAIATLLGYIVSDIICTIVLCKMKMMIISREFIFSSGLMLCAILLWRFVFVGNTMFSTIGAVFICIIFVILYRQDIFLFFNSGLKHRLADYQKNK